MRHPRAASLCCIEADYPDAQNSLGLLLQHNGEAEQSIKAFVKR